ncbi:MAG: SGNH/GDSL hydrolase family protein [Pirellulales bacterium]
MKFLVAPLIWLVLCLPPADAIADDRVEAFQLADGQTVVVLGDSITAGGHYVDCLDIFLTTRLPQWRITIINRGLSSETVAGTSEAGHPGGPRPDLHTRFARTVPPLEPDVVIACYGMNDGIYRSLNEEIFAKYRAGVERLIERVRDEADAEIILCSPPPFDPRPRADRAAENPQADNRPPASDYDDTLAAFTRWLLGLRERRITVIDLHTPLNDVLAARRTTDDEYLLARDGVHQGRTGHLLMAAEILVALHAPAVVEHFQLRADAASQADSPAAWAFTLTSKLPMPQLAEWDEETIRLARFQQRLNRYTLAISDLPPGEYRLSADGATFGRATAAQLAGGVDLHAYPQFPTFARAQQVAELIQQASAIRKKLWIKDDPHPRLARSRQGLQNYQAIAADAEQLQRRARKLAQPQQIALRVEQAD